MIIRTLGRNGAGQLSPVECVPGLRCAEGGRLHALGLDPRRRPAAGGVLLDVAAALASRGERPADLQVCQSSLEDVFLAMTGRGLEG